MDVEYYHMLLWHLLRWSCVFCLLYVVYHIDWFAYTEASLCTGDESTWLWSMIFFMCCWIQFANVLMRIFASIFIKDISLWFSFLAISLSGIGIGVMVASENVFGSVPPSSGFWKSLRRIGTSSPLFGRIACEAIWSWTSICMEF